jgi:mRNA interferase MazF
MKNEYLIQNFDDWNIKKKNLQFLDNSYGHELYFKVGDVWWCSVGLNIGKESFGKGADFRRPVLIIKKLSAELYIVLSLTTKYKVGTWFTNVMLNNEIITL